MITERRIYGDYLIFSAGTMLAGAAAWDFWTHRIPNWWLLFWLIQILFPLFETGWNELIPFFISMVLAVFITSIVFYFRFIGAGDCKLIALMCGYLGIGRGARAVCAGFIIGAAWSLGKLIYYRQFRQRLSYLSAWFRQSIQEQKRIPYFQKDRDGEKAVVPLAVCFLGGFIFTVLLGM